MPTYETFIDDKPKKIEIAKIGEGSFNAKIDDKTHRIEVPSSNSNLESEFAIRIDDKTYRVELPKIERDKPIQLKIEGRSFKAEVKTPITRAAISTFASATSVATIRKGPARNQVTEGTVAAPMTGKIIKIKVQKGDQVKQNQVLCIIEAMKMENEINASKAGTVQEVNVSEGSPVSEGEILFVIG